MSTPRLSKSLLWVLLMIVLSLGSCNVKRRTVIKPADSPGLGRSEAISAADTEKLETDLQAQLKADSLRIFKRVLKSKLRVLTYPDQIRTYYEKNNYQTSLLRRFLVNNEFQYLLSRLERAGDHGLDPELFLAGEIKKAMDDLSRKDSANALATYKKEVALELLGASALLRYSTAMHFGVLVPKLIDSNYFITTDTADAAFVTQVLEVKGLKQYLDNIQPKGRHYLALQAALKSEVAAPGRTKEETRLTLVANLERLRWKNMPAGQKYVLVNIADFSLKVVDKGKSVLKMKVCVGEPGGWETPRLSSKIYTVQVNPVWNIPGSIAKNETIKNAIDDPDYLTNNNIEVYRRGKLLKNASAIEWKAVNAAEYAFKQLPGEQNALGKIKFLFKNQSSVYLHDTPAKAIFKQEDRAVSHGCIRVEHPLKLAQALFGEGPRYNEIKRAMLNGYPHAKYIGLALPVPIVIAYFTALAGDGAGVKFCKDIYGLDEKLAVLLDRKFESKTTYTFGKPVSD